MLSRLMTRREQFLLGFAAAAIAFGAVSLYVHDRWTASHPQDAAMAAAQGAKDPAQIPKARKKPPPPPKPVAQSPASATPHPPIAEQVKQDKPAPAKASEPPAPVAAAPQTVTPPPTPQSKPREISVADVPLLKKTVGVAAMGAVKRPGLFYLSEEARVRELLDRAGGPAADADLDDINVGARLIDGTTLTIPQRPAIGKHRIETASLNPSAYLHSGQGADYIPPQEPPPPDEAVDATAAPQNAQPAAPGVPFSRAPRKNAAPTAPININTASATALAALPGIGPALAARIMARRAVRPFRTIDELIAVSGIGARKFATLRPYVTVE